MTLERIAELQNPEAPFTFINLFEIDEADIEQFLSDWNERSKIMGQMPGYIRADIYKSLLPDHQYQLINVSHWQSYDAFLAANNDPQYAQQLNNDLNNMPEMNIHRGYFRPVASYTHLYRE